MTLAVVLFVGRGAPRDTRSVGDRPSPSLAAAEPAGPTATAAARADPTTRALPHLDLEIGVPDEVTVIEPQLGSSQRNDGSIEVRASAQQATLVRAVVEVDGMEIGGRHLTVSDRGDIVGAIPVFPVGVRTPARLVVRNGNGGLLLATVPFVLEPGPPVSILHPTRQDPEAGVESVWILGAALPSIDRVKVRVAADGSSGGIRRTLDTTPGAADWKAFATELTLSGEDPGKALWLYVSWIDPATGRESAELRVAVRAASP